MGLYNVLALIIVGTIALPFCRKGRLALILWGPIIVADALILHGIFAILPHNVDHTPDSGFVGMAVGLYLLLALPLIIVAAVSLVVAAFAFPKKLAWNLTGILGSLLASALTACVLIEIQTPATSIRVIDEGGKPVPGVVVHFSTLAFDSKRLLGPKTTDINGVVTMHLPPNEWSATVRSEDNMESSVGLGKTARSGITALNLSWRNENWGKLTESVTLEGPFGKRNQFDLRLRASDEVTSPWLAKELHRLLLEALNDGKHVNVMQEMCENLEHFNELELLGLIAKKDKTFSEDVAEILCKDADIIQGFWAGLLIKEGKNSNNSYWPYEYGVLCRWRGFADDPQYIQETIPKLHTQLNQIVNQLLSTAEPLWPNHGPIVFSQLGQLAKQDVPHLLRAMEVSDERWYENFWNALAKSKPDVEQVRPFFQSNNTFVAVAAIFSVRDILTTEDRTTALNILNAIAKPRMSLIPPDPTTTENTVFRHQMNSIWLQEQLKDLVSYIKERQTHLTD